MRSTLLLFALAAALLSATACTNMSKTQQSALSGGALGAGAGMGISALAGGSVGMGAVLGGALGAIGGGIYGHQKE